MTIPGYQEFMLPLLKLAADGKEHTITDAIEQLAQQMRLTPEQRALMLPSGTQTLLYNRVTWALTYLTKSLLLQKTGRGVFKVAPRGVEVLKRNPVRIDNAFLGQFPEYKVFETKRISTALGPVEEKAANPETDSDTTPEEQIEAAHTEMNNALADDLLCRVRAGSPKFFEHLVMRLLTAMGYGGGLVDRAEVTGKSGDDGIDGVIREDRLGLDMVYVQAKKWDNSVGPGEIDKFVGSLSRKKATKGVFITSGEFTKGAERAAAEAKLNVRLIDGDELAELMIACNVGVAEAVTYTVKKVDSDFFDGMA